MWHALRIKYAPSFRRCIAKSQQSEWPIPWLWPLDNSTAKWRLSVIKCLRILFFPISDIIAVSLTRSNITWAWCTDNYQLFMSQHVTGDLCISLSPPCISPSLCSPLASSSVMRNTERANRIETQVISHKKKKSLYWNPSFSLFLARIKTDCSHTKIHSTH